MAYPDGVTTCTLTIGPGDVTATGVSVAVSAEVSLSQDIIHQPTESRIAKFTTKHSPGEDGSIVVTLPHVDQADFVNDAGDSITGWYYTVKVTYLLGTGATHPVVKVVAPLVGTDTLDFDQVPSAAPSGPNLTVADTVASEAAATAVAAAASAGTAATDAITALRGAAGGVASLDGAGLVPVGQVPDLAGRYSSILEASSDVTTAPDGALAVIDTGQSVIATHSSASGSALAVASGVLSNTATNAGVAAGYHEIALSDKVGLIGAEFVFGASGSTSGSRIALACFSPSIHDSTAANGGTVTVGSAAVHCLFSTTGHTFSVWNPGDSTSTVLAPVVGSQAYTHPLVADGVTRYQAEIYIVGQVATVYLPDGTTAVYSDTRISSLMGVTACWEVYLQTASTDYRPGFTALWASPQTTPRHRSGSEMRELTPMVREVTRQKLLSNIPSAITYAPGSPGVTVAVPTSSAAIDATNLNMPSVVVPDTGKILVEFEATLQMSASTSVYWLCILSGSASASASATVIDGAQFTGRARATFIFSGLTPGSIIAVLWKHFAGASGASFFARGDTGRPAFMIVTPCS